MDMVILKGDFNSRYVNNTTCFPFSIQYTVINAIIEVIDWSILENFVLNGKTLLSSPTLLNTYIDIIICQERGKVEIRPHAIF